MTASKEREILMNNLAAQPHPTGSTSQEKEADTVDKKKRESLAQHVYELLRTEILTCTLAPGTEVSEAELAEQFKLSKTPVREALATLRLAGLVRTFPRRGYQIVPVTFGDMNELFDLRTILEAGAAELACKRITAAELDNLDKLADVLYSRTEEPSLAPFIKANRDFHLAIARAADNDRLYNVIERQIDELERYFYLGARLRDVSTETQSDHHAIVQALRGRSTEAVRAIMVRHNEVTRQGLIETLTRSPKLSNMALL